MLRVRCLQRAVLGSSTSISTLSELVVSRGVRREGRNADVQSQLRREDTYAPDTIEILAKSGIDFGRHRTQGIMPNDFAELLITSGLVLSDDSIWIGYHSYV